MLADGLRFAAGPCAAIVLQRAILTSPGEWDGGRAREHHQAKRQVKMKTTLRVARVPYLNTEPFFPEDLSTLPFTVVALPPRQLGEAALRGEIDAGPMAVVDYFRLSDRFEPLADLGIAARGEAQSVLLLSQRPLVQLHGSVIDVTSDTSTSVVLLRLLLEERYHIVPSDYRRLNGATGAAEARLVIGDEALRLRRQDRRMPYLIDLGMEWWLW